MRTWTVHILLHTLLPRVSAPYGWSFSDEENTLNDPWTPCEQDGIMGFCRLSCTAKYSYAPQRMDCPMLPREALLSRAHSRGLERFQIMSGDSFSEVNSGLKAQGASDSETT